MFRQCGLNVLLVWPYCSASVALMFRQCGLNVLPVWPFSFIFILLLYIYIYIYMDTGKSHVCITSRTKNITQVPMGAFQNSLKSIKLFTTWTSGIYIK